MATFKQRLPSRSDALTVFIICIFVSNLWTIMRFLHEIPRYLINLDDAVELAKLFSLFGLQALIDAVMLCAFMCLVAALLPAKWLRDNFAITGSWVVLGYTIWIILKLQWLIKIFGAPFILLSIVVLLLLIAITSIVVTNWPKTPTLIIEKLSILGSLYFGIDAICVLMLAYRIATNVLL